MDGPSDRLRKARIDAGFGRAVDAARRFHWTESTYLSHENGSRGFKSETAREYARAFKVSTSWLLTGEADPRELPSATLSEPDAVPFEAATSLLGASIPPIRYYDLAPDAAHPALYVVGTARLAPFGLLEGDVLVIDLKGRPQEGDLVVATVADESSGEAETVIRRLFAGVLLGPDPNAARPAISLEDRNVAVRGPILANARSMKRARLV